MLQELREYVRMATTIAKTVPRIPGTTERECPCCGNTGRFSGFGDPVRYDALCRRCGSAERHRLFALAHNHLGLFGPTDRVLHFAPEYALTRFVQPRVGSYITADFEPGRAQLVRNIERIEETDASFDVVLAIHVLEHVNDERALAELFRILRPGGRLLLMTPVIAEWDQTYENPTITSEPLRRLHFRQKDHLRLYGRDLTSRLERPGFIVREYKAYGPDFVRYSLIPGDTLFICEKPA